MAGIARKTAASRAARFRIRQISPNLLPGGRFQPANTLLPAMPMLYFQAGNVNGVRILLDFPPVLVYCARAEARRAKWGWPPGCCRRPILFVGLRSRHQQQAACGAEHAAMARRCSMR